MKSSTDSEKSEPILETKSLWIEFSSKMVMFLIETFREEIKPVTSVKFQFEELVKPSDLAFFLKFELSKVRVKE